MDLEEEQDEWEDEEDMGINVTPLIDVSLILVLTFIVTSPLFSKTLMPVTLPKAVTSLTENEENLTISVSPSEGYALNEIPLTKEALKSELRRQMKSSGIRYILIRADERISHGDVEDLMALSRHLGAKRIAFATLPRNTR